MKILIRQPLALHESGKQPLNQDFIFPLANNANPEERLFIICDGEGGTQAGEVASKLVALSISKFFARVPSKGNIDQIYLDKTLEVAEETLTAYKNEHGESKNMRTSLAMLHFGTEQVTMAWVGSCRVYYFDFDKKSLIIAGSEPGTVESNATISGSDKPEQIHFKTISTEDIGSNDYFFLASDGLLEHVNAQTLEGQFNREGKVSPEFLMSEIKNLTEGITEDNYSAYLIQIDKVILPDSPVGIAENVVLGASKSSDEMPETVAGGSGGWMRNAMFFGLIVGLFGLVFLAWFHSRPGTYDSYMAKGNQLLDSGKLSEAIVMYDSALANTDDPVQNGKASGQRGKALALMNQEGSSNPNIDLAESAEAYRDRGDEFFENENYQDAITAYHQAEEAKEQQGDKLTVIPLGRLAEAYMHVGNAQYGEDDRDDTEVLKQYEYAFGIYQSPEVSPENDALLQVAMTRSQELQKALGQDPSDGFRFLAQEKENNAANTTNSRSISSNDSRSATTPDPAVESRNLDDLRTKPSNSASTSTNPTARVAPQKENLTTRNLDPDMEAEMKRRLADGKRLYVQAKDSESGYQYRISAESLEFSAPVLDGAGAYMLAYIYHMGLGGEPDNAKALKYAQKSAQLNWAPGQYLYGHLLLERQYPRDSVTAIQVLEQAVNQNYLEATKRLSEIR